MSRIVLSPLIAVLCGGCYGPEPTAVAETDMSTGAVAGSTSLSPGSTGSTGDGSSTETGEPATSTSSGGETTGGCTPGVFGRSAFGTACFQ